MHDEILDLLEEIGTEKYNEIKIILEDKIFKNSLYLIYTLISLGNELNIDEYYKEAIVVFKNILKTEEDFKKQLVNIYNKGKTIPIESYMSNMGYLHQL